MIRYSSAKPADLEQAASLFLSVYSNILKRFFKKLPSRDFVKDILEVYLEASDSSFIVAKEKGEVVGFVCGVKSVAELWKKALKPRRMLKFLFTPRQIFIMPPSIMHFFSGGHIPLMGVSRKHRLKGIGLKLSDKVSESLREQGVRMLYFQIPLKLVDAYVKHGCNIVKKKKRWAVMKKELS